MGRRTNPTETSENSRGWAVAAICPLRPGASTVRPIVGNYRSRTPPCRRCTVKIDQEIIKWLHPEPSSEFSLQNTQNVRVGVLVSSSTHHTLPHTHPLSRLRAGSRNRSFSRFFPSHKLAPPGPGRHWEGTSLALSEVELVSRSRFDGKSAEPGGGPGVLGLVLLLSDWMTEEDSSLKALAWAAVE